MKSTFLRLFCLLIHFLPERAQARWNHQDSAELNRRTGLGTEYYNDILSYRDPRFWDLIWTQSSMGFRSSAGSLNQKEFLFHQSIRMTSSVQEDWQVAYASDRVEESRQVIDQSALELSYGSKEDGWRLGLLGDAETEKAFMDLGARLRYEPKEGSLWQLIGWSVDPFYTQKKLKREDYRDSKPWSWELLAVQSLGKSTLGLHHAEDGAVVWYQTSKDRRYDYQRQATELSWTYKVDETLDLFLHIEQEKSREAIASLSSMQNQGYKNRYSSIEVGQHLQKGQESFTVSLWGLWERTQMHQASTDAAFDSVGARQEAAFVGYWSRPFWDAKHQQHLGVTLNQVKIDEQKRERSTEVKLIWSPDFVLGPHARMRLTTTWDLDQLADDFPFTETSFHPWGGGQASFLLFF